MKPTLVRKALIICFWMAAWQGAAMLIQNTIIFAGPAATIKALYSQAGTVLFWKSIGTTFFKISMGFLSAFLFGLFTGAAGYRFPVVCEVLDPFIQLLKSVPVASFVILALVWTGSKNLSVIISFLVVYPIVYTGTLSGLKSTDPGLLEMAGVFQITWFKKLRFIHYPALLPFLVTSLGSSIGLCWKSGIAAEVIGVPDFSIGGELYMAKIYLNTADLFAWTMVVIIISGTFEKIFLWLFRKTARLNGECI